MLLEALKGIPERPRLSCSDRSALTSIHVSFSSQSIEQLEKEMLNGQKLQGPQTARELHSILQHKGLVDK